MNLLIVESPAKAKTINKYLGKDYKVLASYGHVRDLPSKSGSVVPENDFALVYEIDKKSEKHLKQISDALKTSNKLILATDPDREGEAISWHIIEALKAKKRIPKTIKIERVVFNEITKDAIKHAIANPRAIDLDLVNAQQARRVLDYLVGFTLSPILWRKLPGSKSAGRVQSVALRLICERESEIEKFKPVEYWDIKVDFKTLKAETFTTKLIAIKDKKLDKFFIKDEKQAKALEKDIASKSYQVKNVTSKTVKRHPQAPFTTSTIQQDASNKLGFSTKMTMQVAQKLYEGIDINGEVIGLITYMRTDGVSISDQAISKIRNYIKGNFDGQYLPKTPHYYKSKIKNAQEAHEAIRPTDITLTPEKIKNSLSDIQYKLYKLIWQRTMASQMSPQELLQTTIDVISTDQYYSLRVTGSVLKFKGFTVVYDIADGKGDVMLPLVKISDPLEFLKILSKQHFTEPPPRYNEASLVKKLEEIGIGRPSTYATIISILLDRNYAKLDKKRFFPEERGMIVTAFLVKFFEQYFEYDFTANLENGLDDISNGGVQWKNFLNKFWQGFQQVSTHVGEIPPQEISTNITNLLEEHYFKNEQGEISRKCSECDDGSLNLRIGKFGAFIACTNYPECKYTRQITDKGEVEVKAEDNILGSNDLGQDILLKKGPYGYYVELLADGKEIKRVSVPKFIAIGEIDKDMALKILELPRLLGVNPNNNQEVKVSNGKFGPYIVSDKKFTSISNDDLFTIKLDRALTLINDNSKKSAAGEVKTLGKHPELNEEIRIMKGRYGPYLKVGKLNVAIPKSLDHEKLDFTQAIELISKKLN